VCSSGTRVDSRSRIAETKKTALPKSSDHSVYVRPSRIVGKRELEGVLAVSGAFIPVLFAPGTQPSGLRKSGL
jgi:hypothetical protein